MRWWAGWCLLIWGSPLWAQNLLLEQQGSVPGASEEMEVVIPTTDGGLLYAGMSNGFSQGDGDGIAVLTDGSGAVRWARTYGDGADNMLIDAVEIPGQGFLLGGWTLTGGDYDFWLVRVDTLGNVLWERRFGGTGDDQVWSVDRAGSDFLVVGGTTSFGAGASDVWVMRLDSAGSIVWQHTYGTPGEDAPPGAYSEYVARGLVDPAGRWVIAGVTNGAGQGALDVFVARLNPADGSVIWAYTYGDTEDEALWNFVAHPFGDGYYLPGNMVNPVTFEGDLWVVRIDTAGGVIWQKTFGVPGVWDEALNGSTVGGDLLAASYVENGSGDWSASLLRIDATGSLLWARTLKQGHLDWSNGVASLADGRIALIGVTTDTTTWDQDILMGLLDNGGTIPGCSPIGGVQLSVAVTGAQRAPLTLSVSTPTLSPRTASALVQSVGLSSTTLCTGTPVEERRDGSRVRLILERGLWWVENPHAKNLRGVVLGPAGRVWRTFAARPGRTRLALPDPPGLYRVILVSPEGGSWTQMVIRLP